MKSVEVNLGIAVNKNLELQRRGNLQKINLHVLGEGILRTQILHKVPTERRHTLDKILKLGKKL